MLKRKPWSLSTHRLLMHGARALLLLLCIGSAYLAVWGKRMAGRVDTYVEVLEAKLPPEYWMGEIQDSDDPVLLKKVCVPLVTSLYKAQTATTLQRREFALASQAYYRDIKVFWGMTAIPLLLAWLATGAILRATKPKHGSSGDTPALTKEDHA